MKVEDPTGQTWRITRRWVPWRRRLRGRISTAADMVPSGLGDDPVSAIVFLICMVIALPFLVIALIAGLELLLVLLLLPFAVLARVLFGQHWTVEVRRGFSIWWDAPSGDWQDSGVLIYDVAHAIRKGEPLPQTIGVVGPAPRSDPESS